MQERSIMRSILYWYLRLTSRNGEALPYLYMYDVTSDGSFTGTVSTSDALTFNPSLSSFGSADGVAATGDVLFAPTTDGYKLRLYYVDNNCKIIGGYEFDCIDK